MNHVGQCSLYYQRDLLLISDSERNEECVYRLFAQRFVIVIYLFFFSEIFL